MSTPPGNPFAANPFAKDSAFGSASPVQTTYQPPVMAAGGAWTSAQPHAEDEDIEPFTMAHLAAQDAVVPAVSMPSAAPAAAVAPATLAFTGGCQEWYCSLLQARCLCAVCDLACQLLTMAASVLQRPALRRVTYPAELALRHHQCRAWPQRRTPRCCWGANRGPAHQAPPLLARPRRIPASSPSITSSATAHISMWTPRCGKIGAIKTSLWQAKSCSCGSCSLASPVCSWEDASG